MSDKRLFSVVSMVLTLCLAFSWHTKAQTTPAIGNTYYIAAQTWDGSKYVERLLYLSGNTVHQTTNIANASRWDALNPANGSGIALRTGGKFLMRGGISSASWGSLIKEPTVSISNPPEGSLCLHSTVTGYNYYIVAPNGGAPFDGTNAATEASYQPKSSLYTPYFKFYDASQPLISVSETMVDGTPSNIGAAYLLTPTHGNPKGGNLWVATDGEITIEKGSYNPLFYTFEGFKVGNDNQLRQSVSASGITANTSIKAVFSTNELDGECFTFISSSPLWYANQRVYKAIYLDPTDNMLKWKTYDPADKAFYFKAHGAFDSLTFESVASPGLYITGATTPMVETALAVTLTPLGGGDYSIVANNENFYAYGHNNGNAAAGTLTGSAGSSGSVAAWWIQSANDPEVEQARYEAALADEAYKADESRRESARTNLLNAINSVTVGDQMGNVAKYDAILSSLFVDKSYTTLRADVTWAEIYEAIDNLPDVLGEMVQKIKTDAWPLGKSGTNWEKMFRIREYPVVSSAAFSGIIKVSYNFSTMNEPTGILAHPGDVVAVMVEDAPKPGSMLRVEMVEGLNRSGSQVNLNQGLNLIQVSEECNLFIYYMISNTADNTSNYLSNFPDIKIHIEGGEVYGCINRVHGPGQTVEEADDLWVRMQQDGLIKNGPMAQVVGESIMLNFNSWDMLQGCPHRIGEVIDIWDSWIKIQQWIMGLRDHDGNIINDYIPNLKERWNNRWLAYERTGGFMNANGGGAQYNTSTIQGIINFNTLKSGGGAWGPVHEHGHDHQTLINMYGMTEVSNNLFSNVCTREFGAIVSRGNSLPDAGNVYARGGNWFDNNIWTMTQMYYKLYLYYHVAGHKPTFYPEVFAKLRANPLLHSAGVAVPADRDYLQFARVCSEVAGEDLSEFFEAYGMLRPLTPEYSLNGASAFEDFNGHNCRIVGDYSTYHVYTTDEMIAQAKADMAACGPKNGNIMFIDDRVRPEPAAHPWAEPGQMRAERSDGGKIGAYGDVGMWSDFKPECRQNYAHDYSLTKESSSAGITLHVVGDGAIGYKIYGPNGELVYFSAFNNILLPAAILDKYDLADLVLVVAQVDGTSVELACDNEKLYTLTTYRNGDAEGISMPVTGRHQPELLGNDVAVLEPIASVDAASYAYASTPNVLVKQADGSYTAGAVSIADKVDFYLPVDATADLASYVRENTSGWTSLCLPFAIEESDLGEGCKIFTAVSLDEEGGTYYLTLGRKKSVEVAEPCFVWSPDDVEEWLVEKSSAGKVTSNVAVALSDDGNLRVNGSFISKEIGEGKYKLNADGSRFGRTTSLGRVTAMRSYIETTSTQNLQLKVRIDDTESGIQDIEISDPSMLSGVMYDLSGRQISAPRAGQPYILNGHVYVNIHD